MPTRYFITYGDATDENYPEKKRQILVAVQKAADAGIESFQIREKRLSVKNLTDLVESAVRTASGYAIAIFVNDRFDVALAAGASGVHLTGASLPVSVVKNSVPDDLLVGVSTHTLEETVDARNSRADFAMYGPVFTTPGKGTPTGLEGLKAVCTAAAPLSVIAVGGIDETNVESVLESGASGYAAIRYLNDFVMMRK